MANPNKNPNTTFIYIGDDLHAKTVYFYNDDTEWDFANIESLGVRGILANNTLGSLGQAFITNGTNTYWGAGVSTNTNVLFNNQNNAVWGTNNFVYNIDTNTLSIKTDQNNTTITENLLIVSNANIRDVANVGGNLNVVVNADIGGNLHVSGANSSFDGNVRVSGTNSSFGGIYDSGNLYVGVNTTLIGNLYVGGANSSFNGNIRVSGVNSSFAGIYDSGNLYVGGTTTLAGNLAVTNIDASGNISADGTLSVQSFNANNTLVIANNLNTLLTTNTTNLNVSNNLTVQTGRLIVNASGVFSTGAINALSFGTSAAGFTANTTLVNANNLTVALVSNTANLNVSGTANAANLNVSGTLNAQSGKLVVNTSGITVGANLAMGTNIISVEGSGIGATNQVLTRSSTGMDWITPAAGLTTGGSSTHVQYNDSTALGGSAGFTFTKTTNNVTIANTLTVGGSATINGSTVNVSNIIVPTSANLVAGRLIVNTSGITAGANLILGTNLINVSGSNGTSGQVLTRSGTAMVWAAACTGGGGTITSLSGDVTSTGSPVATTTISSGVVTYAKVASGAIATGTEFAACTASKLLSAQGVWSAASLIGSTAAAGSTQTLNFGAGFNFQITINGSFNLANPSNMKLGQSGYIVLDQTGAGYTITYTGGYWKFPAGYSKALSGTSGAKDILYYVVVSSVFIACSLHKGYA